MVGQGHLKDDAAGSSRILVRSLSQVSGLSTYGPNQPIPGELEVSSLYSVSSGSQTTQGQRCKEHLLYTLHHLSEGAIANTSNGDWDITRARSATKETAQASKLPVIMKPLLKFGGDEACGMDRLAERGGRGWVQLVRLRETLCENP